MSSSCYLKHCNPVGKSEPASKNCNFFGTHTHTPAPFWEVASQTKPPELFPIYFQCSAMLLLLLISAQHSSISFWVTSYCCDLFRIPLLESQISYMCFPLVRVGQLCSLLPVPLWFSPGIFDPPHQRTYRMVISVWFNVSPSQVQQLTSGCPWHIPPQSMFCSCAAGCLPSQSSSLGEVKRTARTRYTLTKGRSNCGAQLHLLNKSIPLSLEFGRSC